MFKNTKAFELITILEKMLINNRFWNSLLFIIKYEAYNFITKKFIIKKNMSPEKTMELFKEFFKEFFDVYNKLKTDNTDIRTSKMTYNISNNKIDCIISYLSYNLSYYITYDLSNDYFTLFIKTNNKGFNIDERNLQINYINEIAYNSLNILFDDMITKLLTIFHKNLKINRNIYYKKEKEDRKDV